MTPAAADPRIWTARTLEAAGGNVAVIARQTGLAREAVQLLRSQRPAESAGAGTNYRA
jgi:hypothetical protein